MACDVKDSHEFSLFFPSNAFMASARSLHTFIRGQLVNCSLHAGLMSSLVPLKQTLSAFPQRQQHWLHGIHSCPGAKMCATPTS